MNSQGHDTNGAIPAQSAAGARGMGSAWLACALVTVAVTMLTLRLSPVAWTDEVMILDYGRILLPGADTGHALNWSPEGRPVLPLTYLGCIASEASYRLAGNDMAGPRLLSLLGAVVASWTMFRYLRAHGILQPIGLALAAALLWDPIFAEGYRGARCDCWSIAAMVGACWSIKSSATESGISMRGLVLSGMLVAVAGMTWMSAIILLPLVALEAIDASLRTSTPSRSAATLRSLGIVASTTVAAMTLLALPFASSLAQMVGDTIASTKGTLSGDRAYTFRPWSVADGVLGLMRTPLVVAAAAVSLAWCRQWRLASALGVAFAVVMATGPYNHRNVYLEPYMLLAIAIAAQAAWTSGRPIVARAAVGSLLLISLGAAAVTLGARTAIALRDRAARDPSVALEQLAEQIGPGDRAVYIGAMRAYYGARALGWRYVRPFPETVESARRVLERCTAAVIDPANKNDVATPELLRELGYRDLDPGDDARRRPFRILVRQDAPVPPADAAP